MTEQNERDPRPDNLRVDKITIFGLAAIVIGFLILIPTIISSSRKIEDLSATILTSTVMVTTESFEEVSPGILYSQSNFHRTVLKSELLSQLEYHPSFEDHEALQAKSTIHMWPKQAMSRSYTHTVELDSGEQKNESGFKKVHASLGMNGFIGARYNDGQVELNVELNVNGSWPTLEEGQLKNKSMRSLTPLTYLGKIPKDSTLIYIKEFDDKHCVIHSIKVVDYTIR